MSKSLARVQLAAEALGLQVDVQKMDRSTRSAAEAAAVVSCELDQIAKSVIFRGGETEQALLFLTAGGNRVNENKASALAGEALKRADADFIRATTGFAIGGVAPIGHLNPVRAWFDLRLNEFSEIWAAAGTPHHMFVVEPAALIAASKATLADFT